MPSTGKASVLLLLTSLVTLLLGGSVLAQEDSREVRIGTFQLHPLNYIDDDGKAKGLYPDLIRATAEGAGWQVEFVPGDWPTCLERLQAGEIDLMTTIAYSPERAEVMDYSREAVCDIWGQVFVRPDGGISGMRDLAGKPVGIVRRDINAANFVQLIQRLGIACDLREYDSHDAIFSAARQGDVVGGVAPQHFGLRHAADYGLVASTIQFAPFSVFFATRKGRNGDLLRALDERLVAWKSGSDSYYYRQLNHWMGVDPIERQVFPPWLIAAIVGALGLAGFLFVANRLLNARVRSRTIELRRREREYRGLVESANCVIVRLDPQGRIKYMNPYGLGLFGFTLEELVGESVVGTFVPENEEGGRDLTEMVKDVFAHPETYELNENENIRKDGTRLHMQWSNRALVDESGDLVELVSIGIDSTERRRLENEMLQARKMQAVGTLAGGIAHDFNNMLHGILGASELLAEGARDDQRQYIQLINRSSERAAELIGQLLAFSRKGEFTMRPVDLAAVVSDAVKLLERSIDKKIVIEIDVPRGSWVLGNAAQLQNVVINLGVNAGHAMMPGGGRLVIAAQRVHVGQDACRVTGFDIVPGAFLSLAVTDEGRGIPAEALGKVFEPFFTTKEHQKGTGLGLSAVFGIVQSHRGAIDVKSTVDRGTCFTVLLPAAEQGSDGAELGSDSREHSGTILVVDDEPLVREITAKLLSSLGYEVVVAANGREAVDLFERDPQAIDAALVDMIMPVMNGCETFDELTSRRPDLPIVIASGYAEDDAIADFRARGLCEFLVKPVAKADLARVFARLLPRRKNGG